MSVRKKKALTILLFASSLIVSLIVAEVSLHILGIPPPVVSGWLNIGTEAHMNQLGFRGQKIIYTDNDFVVVLLGDSQVAAAACSFDGLPERRLEHYLNQRSAGKNIRVFSLAGIGYGQDQELLMLERYFQRYRADLVVLWLTPENDVWNNIFPTHWPKNGWPKPTYWIENGSLRGPGEQFGEELWWSRIKLLSLLNRQFQFIDRDGDWEKRLPQPYKPLSGHEGEVCNDWQSRWDNYAVLMRDENLDTEKSHLSLGLTPASPRMQYGLDLTRALLQKIEDLARRNHGKVVIFYAETPEQETCPGDTVLHLLNGKYYATSQNQMRDNLNYINAGFLSFAVPVTLSQWQVSLRNYHLNEAATDQVMRDLSIKVQPLLAGNSRGIRNER